MCGTCATAAAAPSYTLPSFLQQHVCDLETTGGSWARYVLDVHNNGGGCFHKLQTYLTRWCAAPKPAEAGRGSVRAGRAKQWRRLLPGRRAGRQDVARRRRHRAHRGQRRRQVTATMLDLLSRRAPCSIPVSCMTAAPSSSPAATGAGDHSQIFPDLNTECHSDSLHCRAGAALCRGGAPTAASTTWIASCKPYLV